MFRRLPLRYHGLYILKKQQTYHIEETETIMKRKAIGTADIVRVDYPNRGRFFFTEEDGTEVRGTIKNAIPGQKIQFRVCKKHKGRVEGSVIELLEHSPLETVEPTCDIAENCGGCIYQRMEYREQLSLKEDMVKRLLEPVMPDDVIYDGIKGSPKEHEFRNKMDYSFGNEERGGELRLGLHKKATRYTVLNAESCTNVHHNLGEILTCVREYCLEKDLPIYNKLAHEGYLRFLLVRRSEATGEILICLAHTSQMEHDFTELKDRLLALSLDESKIAGIWTTVDDSFGDALKPEEMTCLYGQDSMMEQLLGLDFKVTLFSFFQTNSLGAEVLYDTVRQYVNSSDSIEHRTEAEKPVIYDLYCGTGTIGQIVSPVASQVYGIELIPEAVVAANENAKLNGITNCEFFAGDVMETLPTIVEKARPDYIILDPPREGIRPQTLRQLMNFDVENMVYVSCKASSFVQDMAVMRDYGWQAERYTLVDMFPHSAHVELVVLLKKVREQ